MGSESVFVQPAIPKFDGHYDHWSMLMENFLRSKEYWDLVETGITSPIEGGEELTEAKKKAINAEKLKDLKCKNYLFQAIDRSILTTILKKDTSKEIWDSLKQKYQGAARVQRAQRQALRKEFEVLHMKNGESVNDYFGRTLTIANKLRMTGGKMENVEDEQALQVTHQEGRGRGRGFYRGRGRGRGQGRGGHFQWECPKEVKSTAYYTEAKEEMLLMSLVECKQTTYEHLWFLDSGCSDHMCGNKDMFVDLDSMFK
nr:hypothetical protein [Tanacetum cinerariifolium]